MKQTQQIRAGEARDPDNHHAAPLEEKEILADSREVLKVYFEEKIAGLHLELDRLNFLDDSREISRYCHEIMELQKKLRSLEGKLNF